MAYENFIPSVWAVGIERDLERECVFIEDCNRKYEGTISKEGQSVTILGVGKPTIKKISKADKNKNIDEAEEIEDTSVTMYINQIAYFNYMVGDIDKAQAKDGVMDALSAETSEALANEVDSYVASMVVDASVKPLYEEPKKVVASETPAAGEVNVLDVIDEALEKLYENDVKQSTKIIITISPRFYKLFKKAYLKNDTNNSDILKHGKVAMYGNVTVKMSNNVYKTANGSVDNIMIRTQRAIAYAQPLTHTEAYRPEKKFADAVKGFILYDSKVVRPKEIININVKYS